MQIPIVSTLSNLFFHFIKICSILKYSNYVVNIFLFLKGTCLGKRFRIAWGILLVPVMIVSVLSNWFETFDALLFFVFLYFYAPTNINPFPSSENNFFSLYLKIIFTTSAVRGIFTDVLLEGWFFLVVMFNYFLCRSFLQWIPEFKCRKETVMSKWKVFYRVLRQIKKVVLTFSDCSVVEKMPCILYSWFFHKSTWFIPTTD